MFTQTHEGAIMWPYFFEQLQSAVGELESAEQGESRPFLAESNETVSTWALWTLLGHSESGKRSKQSNPPKLSGCTHGKLQWCQWFGVEWASMSYLIRGVVLLYYEFSPKKKHELVNEKHIFKVFLCRYELFWVDLFHQKWIEL